MKRVLIYILTAVVFTLSVICFYESCHPEKEAFIRQDTERDLADQYLIYIENLNVNSALTFNECHSDEGDLTDDSDFLSYSDETYYERDGVTFTPDYAKGYLQCVLEIPKESVQIRRGVYSGTWDDIMYDLDIWMVTAARPDFVLGETRYVIYGHNHTVQDLSFNRLKNVEVGDIFYLTDEMGYEITM